MLTKLHQLAWDYVCLPILQVFFTVFAAFSGLFLFVFVVTFVFWFVGLFISPIPFSAR